MADQAGAKRKPMQYEDLNLRLAYYEAGHKTFKVWIEGEAPGGTMRPDAAVTRTYNPGAFWKDPVLGRGGLLGKLDLGEPEKKDLFQLGRLLAELALPEKTIRPLFDKSLIAVRSRGMGLRLRLRIDAAELAELPWEFMMLPRTSGESQDTDFLALQREISIVRTDTSELVALEPPGRPVVQVVGVLSCPKGEDKLKLARDKQSVDQAVQTCNEKAGKVVAEVKWTGRPATRAKLVDVLGTDNPDIFQYSGHAAFALDEGVLLLENPQYQPDPYPAAQLVQLLRNAGVRLVVLSACETGRRNGRMIWSGVAPALTREKIPAVVANQFKILDTNANLIAEQLYLCLLSGYTIDEAVFQTRQAMYQAAGLENPDWGALVLYLQAKQGVLFPQFASQLTEGTDQIQGKAWQAPRMQPPGERTPLLGRDDDLNLAQATLREGGKVYFHGTYGVGKTSLAAELYRRAAQEKAFGDGCLWYPVGKLSAEQVLERIAEKFPEQQVAQATTREDKIAALGELLSQHDDLLIGLDEVPDRSVAQAILQAAGSCAVVFNGTQRLNLAGKATERRLRPLGPALAMQLFKGLADPAGGLLTADDERLVRKICERMRYLPLAVKLAALKFADRTESLQSLWDRLRAEPQSLEDPNDGVVAIFSTHYQDRQQTPTAWQLLVRIASFPAAEAPEEALRAGQTDFYSAKDRLVNLGLVDFVGTDRLALHPLLGTQVQRVEPQAVQNEREQTANWLVQYAHDHTDDYDALEQERANLLGLLDWFTENRQWDRIVDVMRALFDYLRVRGQWQEAFQRLDTVLTSVDEVAKPWNRAWAYLHRGIMHTLRGDYAPAWADIDRADRMFAEVGDQPYRGKALYRRAIILILWGEMDRARRDLKQSIALMGEAEPLRSTRADAHERLGELLAMQGKVKLAQQQFQQTLALGDTEEQARAHLALGELARRRGDFTTAQKQLNGAAQFINRINDILQRAALLQQLGYLHYYQGRTDSALNAFESARTIYEDLKYQPGLAHTQHALGNVALARQDLESARGYYEKALEINTSGRQAADAAFNQYQLALIDQRQNHLDEATRDFEKVLRAAGEMKDMRLQAATLHQLSGLALTRGDHAQAVKYNRRAEALAGQAGDRLTEVSAQYYWGLLQAREGHLQAAQDTLAWAHAAFVALNAPQADAVAAVLETLQQGNRLNVAQGGLFDPIPAGHVVTEAERKAVTAGHIVVQASVVELWREDT